MQIWCFSVRWKGKNDAVYGCFKQSKVKIFFVAHIMGDI